MAVRWLESVRQTGNSKTRKGQFMKSGKKEPKQVLTEYQEIELSKIDEPDGRIRLTIDMDEIVELADNIKEVGQLQPILLAIHGKRFEIVAGERRFLAIKSLGRKKINAVIRSMSKAQIALSRASENLMRKDLSPIEEAAVYVDLYDNHNLTPKAIGDQFGVSGMTIKRKMDLLRLPDIIQKAIHSKQMSVAVGEELAKIQDDKELKRYIAIAVENGVTLTVAKTWTDDYRKALQYIDNREELPGPDIDFIAPTKSFTACQVCEKPIEYKDVRIVRMCEACFKNLLEALKH